MKKILITGSCGFIGKNLLSYLLSEGKYDITILDLYNKKNEKYLKKYINRVNIVYGDINDKKQIEFLVRNQDIIFHLASLNLPFTEYKNNLHNIINIEGTMHLIKAIKESNPHCHLFYLSSTAVYDNTLSEVSIRSKVNKNTKCNYIKDILKIENDIKKNLKNYTIFRCSMAVDKHYPKLMNFTEKNKNIEVISLDNLSNALCKAVSKIDKLNKKTYNLSGGKDCQTTFISFKNNVLKCCGINNSYLKDMIINKKDYISFYVKDSDILNDILNFQTDSLNNIYLSMKNYNSKNKIRKSISKILIREKNEK